MKVNITIKNRVARSRLVVSLVQNLLGDWRVFYKSSTLRSYVGESIPRLHSSQNTYNVVSKLTVSCRYFKKKNLRLEENLCIAVIRGVVVRIKWLIERIFCYSLQSLHYRQNTLRKRRELVANFTGRRQERPELEPEVSVE